MGSDDWIVPGGMVIADGVGKLHLHVPGHWRRDILEVTRRPRSMNTNVGRGHWRGFHGLKKSWQDEIEKLLMLARTPRGNQRAVAGAFIRFERKMARPPDPGNYATVINKALGDALVNYDAIPDDDAQHYFFGGVEFEEEIGRPRTTIFVYTQPQEEEDVTSQEQS